MRLWLPAQTTKRRAYSLIVSTMYLIEVPLSSEIVFSTTNTKLRPVLSLKMRSIL